MSPDDEIYVVIAEMKNQAPIIMETEQGCAGYDKVHERMDAMSGQPNVVRVCVARLLYETGNKALFDAMK